MEAVRALHLFAPGPLLAAVQRSGQKRSLCAHHRQATSLARPTLPNLYRTGHVSHPRHELCRHSSKARSGGVAARARVDEQSQPETEAAKLVLCLRSELSSLGAQQPSAVSSAAITQLTTLCQGGHDQKVVVALSQVQSCL